MRSCCRIFRWFICKYCFLMNPAAIAVIPCVLCRPLVCTETLPLLNVFRAWLFQHWAASNEGTLPPMASALLQRSVLLSATRGLLPHAATRPAEARLNRLSVSLCKIGLHRANWWLSLLTPALSHPHYSATCQCQVVSMAGHAGGIEPDLEESNRETWRTVGDDLQQVLKKCDVDAAKAYLTASKQARLVS